MTRSHQANRSFTSCTASRMPLVTPSISALMTFPTPSCEKNASTSFTRSAKDGISSLPSVCSSFPRVFCRSIRLSLNRFAAS
ncbi:hypothetical protein CH341_31490, partial [Rhodoplanes roseus]